MRHLHFEGAPWHSVLAPQHVLSPLVAVGPEAGGDDAKDHDHGEEHLRHHLWLSYSFSSSEKATQRASQASSVQECVAVHSVYIAPNHGRLVNL